jgi:hypothetical protein
MYGDFTLFHYVLSMLLCCGMCAGLLTVPACAEETEQPIASRRIYDRGDLPKIVSVVTTKTPPTIDGVMDPGEWEAAAAITGLTRVKTIGQPGVAPHEEYQLENVAGDQSTFWITYDDQHLYIAHHSPPPARIGDAPAVIAVMLKQAQIQHDANIDQDDAIHVAFFDPVYPGGDKYVIQMNSIGTVFECIWYAEGYTWEKALMDAKLGKTRGITVSWDPPVRTKSTLTLNGWVLEAAIPWAGLGPNITKPAPGSVRHMNFGRIWKEVMQENHAWKAHDRLSPAGQVRFQGDEGIVVQLQDTGNVPRGQAAFAAAITNRYAAERKLTARVSTDSGELQDTKEFTLAPGERTSYAYQGRVTDFTTTTIAFTVTDAASGEVVHATTLPVIRKTEPDIYARRYRSRDEMKFETDIAFIGAAELKKTRVDLTMTNTQTGKRVFRKTYKGFTSYEPEFTLSTRDWEPGEYEARFVFSAPGMKSYTTVVPYTHPALPEWWDNQYGNEDMLRDRVPYPWTPMEVKDDSVGVWGRQYRFGQRLLPEQITTLDAPMLRAPMRLLVKTTDGEVLDSTAVNADVTWSKTNKTRVESQRTIAGKSLDLRNAVWSEYDGLVWNALTIAPKKKITIASMELEIPLTKAFTDVINPRDYSLRTTGKLQPEGLVCEPTRAVWLGNAEGGLQWFCETDGWLFLKDAKQALRVEMHDGVATLRIAMIDVPTVFDAPHEIQFGFVATPVRPNTWRTPEHPRYRNYPTGAGMFWDSNNEVVPGALNWMSGLYVGTAVTNPGQEAFALYADEWRPDQRDRSSTKTGRWVPVTMSSKTLRDYYAWRHWYRQHKHWRGFSGLYYDCSGANPSANPYVGTGYQRRDGSWAPTYPFLAERDITRRLYNITLSDPDYASRDAWIGYHHSGMPNMAYMSFANANWNAENLGSRINEQQQTYRGVVDPAMYRAEFLGHNFGWPVFFLGQGRIRPEWIEPNGGAEAVFDQIYGLNLLHDGGGVCCILPGGPMRELQYRREQDVKALGLQHWAFQFTPYWKQDIVALPADKMYASLYIARPSVLTATNPQEYINRGRVYTAYFDKHLTSWITGRNNHEVELARPELERMQDRAILVLYNDSAWEGEVRLKVDWKKLGLGAPETLKATNALHSTGFRLEKAKDKDGKEIEQAVFFNRPEENARIENGELIFPMTKYNYRLILIEKHTVQ